MIFDAIPSIPRGSRALGFFKRILRKPTFTAGETHAGASDGSQQATQPGFQAASLRLRRIARFGAVGAMGTLVNLVVMAILVHGVFRFEYVAAAVVAAEISMIHNFVLQERFVFRDEWQSARPRRERLTQHLVFNNAEALVRLPFLVLLVETMHVWSLLAQGVTLAVAFVARYVFTSRVVYRSKSFEPPNHHTNSTRAAPIEAETG